MCIFNLSYRQRIFLFLKSPGKTSSKTYALRAIKRFERINRVKFNPKRGDHMRAIYVAADNEQFIRRCKMHFKKWRLGMFEHKKARVGSAGKVLTGD